MNDSDNGGTIEQGNLGLWSVISIIVGIVVGVSIFKVPGTIFSFSSDPWSGLAVWAFGGLLALIGAFCYAELATTYPRSGGDYVYLTRGFGPLCGFLFGWAQLCVLLPASIGAMAIVFADFATTIYELPDFTGLGLSSEFTYAVSAVLLLSLLNILGVTVGKLAQNLLTVAKVIGILGILVAGFGYAQANPLEWRLGEPGFLVFVEGRPVRQLGEVGWGALAMILVLYAYGGWNDAAFVAAEVRNPRRNIPWALLLGVGMITLIYLLINAAYLTGLGFDGVTADSPVPVPARLLDHAFGPAGAKAMSVIVMISALGAANGLIFTGARVYATLGNDHSLFGWLGYWRPGHGAPILALIVQGFITVGMIAAVATPGGHAMINEVLHFASQVIDSAGLANRIRIAPGGDWNAGNAFDVLVSHTAPVFWIFFLATGFSLFALRTRDPNRERPFRVPLYPVLPFIFCNMCVYMLYQSLMYVKERALFAVVLVLLGLPLYFLSRAIGYHGNSED